MEALVQLDHVTKTYDSGAAPAVSDVSLTVAPGEAVAIMGPSGSGKSTLLNLIAGMDRPTTGEIRVGGVRVDKLSETGVARFRRSQVGMIFQFFNLLDDMTVIDNVLLPAQLAGMPSAKARARAEELLTSLRITPRRDAYPARLSGGERQRVAIARALVNRPAVLLADEPTGAVDIATGEEIGELLLDLNASGQTLILVTHNPDLAAKYAQRVVSIEDGSVVSDSGGIPPNPPASDSGGIPPNPPASDSGGIPRTPQPATRGRGGEGDHPGRTGRPGRRLQAVVIGLVVLACTAASVLAVGMLVDSRSPFDRGFAAQHGADVTADMSQSAASPAQLAASSHVSGVTGTAGPFPEATVGAKVTVPGIRGSAVIQLHLVGRSSPNGPVDDLTLKSGHWPTAPDQVVWSQTGPLSGGIQLGATVSFPGAPGSPALTVVGFANSITNTADAWVLPAEIATLSGTGSQPQAQMLYRFSSASTATAVNADVSALKAALPAGTVQETASYLDVRASEQSNVAIWAPFIIAFGIMALVMSVLIVANVVSGAVIAGTTRIGVLKAVGFTPAQVTGSYVLQVAVPALAGCVVGAVLGVLLAIPILSQNASVYGVGSLSIPLWVEVSVPLVILGLTAVGAMLPALRAGRMSATQAIATGRAPRAAHGYLAHRLLGRLRRAPRAATIGLAAPFSRPGRTAVTAGAIMFGAVAVTFGVGLSATLNRVYVDLRLANTAPLRVQPAPSGQVLSQPGQPKKVIGTGGPPSASPAEQRTIAAALTANPDIAHWVPETDAQVGVAGLSQQAQVTAFDGNASWTGYQVIKGSWYSGSGSVDVNTTFLTDTGTSVGSTVTLTSGGRSETVRIAGEAFANDSSEPNVFMSGSDLARIDPGQLPSQYYAGVRPGTDPQAVANALEATLDPSGPSPANIGGIQVTPNDNGELIAVVALITLLTLLLIVVAGLGVLNTVVLQLRERVHDLGVFKSVGMTPRQAVAMVVCSVTLIGLLAGIVAVPLGVLVHNGVVPVMGHAADTDLPAAVIAVYSWWQYILLALAGLVIAVVAALGPASWAARTRTAFALRAE